MAKHKTTPRRSLVVQRNRSNAVLAIIAGALLAMVGVFLLVISVPEVGGDITDLLMGLIACVGGVALVVWGGKLLSTGTLILAVDDRGIEDRTSPHAPGLVPWDQMSAVYSTEDPTGAYLCVELTDPEAFAQTLPPKQSSLVRTNTQAGLAAVRVPMAPMASACTVKDVMAVCRRQRPGLCHGKRGAKSS